jgi:RNA polymerase sigma-54 factor
MPTTELIQHIEQELELNPLLEPADQSGPATGEPESETGSSASDDGGYSERWLGNDIDVDGHKTDLASRSPTLREHLATQIATDIAGPAERVIAMTLLEGLDESGYLTADLHDVAERLGTTEPQVVSLLAKLQQLDPPGVFARSLAECLGAQLADRGLLEEPMALLLQHLDLVASGDFAKLVKSIGVDASKLRCMLATLRRLDPKPGLAFEATTPESLIPDVLMQPRPEGGWTLELNPGALPRLIVNRRYYAELVRTARSTEAHNYVVERLASAKWLVRALDQRARTILKVATEIVRRQDGFFVHGVGQLKPLVLRDVANTINMHESTISRATSNKFMATPRGTFELRYFFATAVSSCAAGESVAAEAVKSRIRELIERESPRMPHSDDRLVELLREGGVDIARRTVAKYRESLRIPSSVGRRRRNAFAP